MYTNEDKGQEWKRRERMERCQYTISRGRQDKEEEEEEEENLRFDDSYDGTTTS